MSSCNCLLKTTHWFQLLSWNSQNLIILTATKIFSSLVHLFLSFLYKHFFIYLHKLFTIFSEIPLMFLFMFLFSFYKKGSFTSDNIFNEVLPLCDRTNELIISVFTNPESVMGKLVQRIYLGPLKVRHFSGGVPENYWYTNAIALILEWYVLSGNVSICFNFKMILPCSFRELKFGYSHFL